MGGFSQRIIVLARPAVLVGTLVLASAPEAQAQTVREGAEPGRTTVVLANGAVFDWRRNKAPQHASRAIGPPAMGDLPSGFRLGNGSYVCSPAGFGRRSFCVSR